MTQQSLDQITPADLAKINHYLDEVEQDLLNYHSRSEVGEIIKIIREQLFQEIELQATIRQEFDVGSIIRKNREENRALLSGDDKNEVVFSFSRPNWLQFSSNRERNEKIENLEDPALDLNDLERRVYESNDNAFRFLIPIAILYAFLALIPIYDLQLLNLGVLLAFVSVSLLKVKLPTKIWLQANLIIFVGVQILIIQTYWSYVDEIIALYAPLFLPLYLFFFSYQLLVTEKFINRFNTKSNFSKFLYSSVLATALYLVVFVYGSVLYTIYEVAGAGGALFSILILNGLFYYFVVDEYTRNWDQDILQMLEELPQRDISSVGLATSGSELHAKDSSSSSSPSPSMKTDPSQQSPQKQVQKPQSSDQAQGVQQRKGRQIQNIVEYFGVQSSSEKLRLNINTLEAKKYTSFRFLTWFRLLLVLVAVGSMASGLFFLNIRGEYALAYYIDILELEGFYGGNTDLFQYHFGYGALYLGIFVWAYFVLLLTMEVLVYLYRRTTRKVISHLMLRQGVISIETLSTAPPGVDGEKYYNILGEMIMNDLISITHLEGTT